MFFKGFFIIAFGGLLILFLSCRDKKVNKDNLLIGNWKVALTAITKQSTSDEDACSYISKPSDLHLPPLVQKCVADDVWQFSKDVLTIIKGDIKCLPEEEGNSVTSYTQSGEDLSFDGTDYKIILLTKDTLIIDNCVEVANYDPGREPRQPTKMRFAQKFYRVR